MTFEADRPIDDPPTLGVDERLGEGGRYLIRRRVGVGGMAEVYRAVDTRLGSRVVAIKLLSAKVARHAFADRLRNLFIQEAQALSRVKDDNVVDVLDFGMAADGRPYMVMEFLQGAELGALLIRDGQLSIGRSVDVVLGVCAGIHACHLAGIIHRDLKPANVFVTRTTQGEQAKVLDFSVAKVPIARSTSSSDKPKTDLIVGTPSYMSPEQALGEPASELSDQYSIGALLYRCLTGRAPRGAALFPNEVHKDIPERLDLVLRRALDLIPDRRFSSVHAFGQALLAFASSEGRGKWRLYYRSAPAAIDPTTTGSLLPVVRDEADVTPFAEGAREIATQSAVETVNVRPATCDPHNVEAREDGIDREPSGSEPCAPAVVANATMPADDGGVQEVRSSGQHDDVEVSDARKRSPSGIARRPSRFLVCFAAIAALIVEITILATLNRRAPNPVAVAPAWVRDLGSEYSAPLAPMSEVAAPRVAPSISTPTPSRPASHAPRAPSSSKRAARRKRALRPVTKTTAVQYGPDGLPILH